MSRDINKLHPIMQTLASALVAECAKEGLKIKITDCVRTKAEQNTIDASRTNAKYPYSYHNWGLAFDFCRNDGKGAYNTDGKFFQKVGAIGKKMGLEWGGDWTSPVDMPHFQWNYLSDGKNNAAYLVWKYGDPDKLIQNVDWLAPVPTKEIYPTSNPKDIIWLQAMLCKHGFICTVDGVWGKNTCSMVKAYWKDATGKSCTGKRISKNCIQLLKN